MNTPVLPTPALREQGENQNRTYTRIWECVSIYNQNVPLDIQTILFTLPAVDHYSGVVMAMCSDSFDKLNQGAAGFWDPVLRP